MDGGPSPTSSWGDRLVSVSDLDISVQTYTVMRHILEKRREWGMGTVIARLDIA